MSLSGQTESPLSPWLTPTNQPHHSPAHKSLPLSETKVKGVPHTSSQALLTGKNLIKVTGILPPAGSSQEQNDDCASGPNIKERSTVGIRYGLENEKQGSVHSAETALRKHQPAWELRASSRVVKGSEESSWKVTQLPKSDGKTTEHRDCGCLPPSTSCLRYTGTWARRQPSLLHLSGSHLPVSGSPLSTPS